MMRLLSNKKNTKIISLLVAAIFIIGIAALAYTQMATPASAAAESNIGVVDTSKLLTDDSPLVANAEKEFSDYQAQLKTQFEQETANMDDQAKQQKSLEYKQKMEAKQQELQKGLQDKIAEAAKSVGDAKGLTVVLDKRAVLYGGVDVTEQVTKKLSDAK